MSITEKLLKNSTIKMTAILDKSTVFNLSPPVATNLPILNLAFSGEVSGGFQSGLIVFAGESKTFKSNLLLLCVAAYLKKHSDAVCLFYDSEFGSKADYFLSFGIDPQRVIHTPITNVENFKFDLMAQVNEIEKKDHVIIAVDSVGNLASKKEVDDALKGESKADMTRAKAFKSLFRMVTPELTLRDIPMLVVAHVYSTQELYSKTIISGGCLAAGTKLIMFDGTTKNIEDIIPGDLVLTPIGPKIVTHTWNPETLDEGTPECLKIIFEDDSEVICSHNHPFLLNGEFVEASELEVNNVVSVIK